MGTNWKGNVKKRPFYSSNRVKLRGDAFLSESVRKEKGRKQNKAICMAKRCPDKQGGSRVVARRTGRVLSSGGKSAVLSSFW